jgi:hypothetical protein
MLLRLLVAKTLVKQIFPASFQQGLFPLESPPATPINGIIAILSKH